MQQKSISAKFIALWRVRITLLAFIPAFISAAALLVSLPLFWVLTVLWVGSYLFFFWFYIPCAYKKYAYGLHNGNLVVNHGVFFSRCSVVPLTMVQYTSLSATPLMKLLGLRAICIYSVGTRVVIDALPTDDALFLQQQLLPQKEVPNEAQ